MKLDQELINAFVKAYDENAFAEIVSRHSRMVHRVCYRILGDAHEVEDATQAVFIVLMKKAASLQKKSGLGSWLYGVARNVALHALRSRVRISQREEEYATVQKSMAQDNIPDTDREAVLKLLDRGIASLTERQRQAVVLRYLEGYSEKEAAELTGCSAVALKSRANDGIMKLRKKLAKHGAVISMAVLFEVLKGEAEAAVLSTLLPSVLAAVKGAATGVATTAVTINVMALAKGGLKMLFWKKVCTVSCTLGIIGMVGGAGTIIATQIGSKDAEEVNGKEYLWTTYTKADGLPGGRIHGIAVDSKDNIWIGAWGVLSKYDGKSFTNYTEADGLASYPIIFSIAIDSKDNIWTGYFAGLSKYDRKSSTKYTKADGLPGNHVRSIAVDSGDNIWIATLSYKEGVSKYDGKSFANYTEADGLASYPIYSIAIDSKDNIWTGNFAGLSKYDGVSLTKYTKADGLPNNRINSIAVDSKDNIWCGTWPSGRGLSKYDGISFTNYTEADGLPSNNVYSIAIDSKDNIWIATGAGLSKGEERRTTPYILKGNIPSDISTDVRNKIVGESIYTNSQKALEKALSIDDKIDRWKALEKIGKAVASKNVEEAIGLKNQIELEDDKAFFVQVVLSHWAEKSLKKATSWAEKLPEGKERTGALRAVSTEWAMLGQKDALVWIEGLPEGESKNEAMSAIVQLWAIKRQYKIASMLSEKIPPGEARRKAQIWSASSWAADDPVAAAAWVEGLPQGPGRQGALRAVAGKWTRSNLQAVLAWAQTLPEKDQRYVEEVIEQYKKDY